MLVRVDRHTTDRRGQSTRETRYFVTSLDPQTVTPQQLLKYVRGHWQIENSLHFVKDRWWDEDRHWNRRPGLAERLASLANVGLAPPEWKIPQSPASPSRRASLESPPRPQTRRSLELTTLQSSWSGTRSPLAFSA
ncbi:MAG: transposase, partial [Planctomycetia bacterium]|nr:transposase [Planctomycetia bacterium]